VFTGKYEGEIIPDKNEVEDYCFMDMPAIKNAIQSHPQKYTEWFKIAFPKLEVFLASNT
jgi:isopentenyl-diphosphate Delta-isomerase